jgi:hypothetical protein
LRSILPNSAQERNLTIVSARTGHIGLDSLAFKLTLSPGLILVPDAEIG